MAYLASLLLRDDAEAILVDEQIPVPERPALRPGRNPDPNQHLTIIQRNKKKKPTERKRGEAEAYRNLPMAVSWDGSVTMIGFQGVAMGSPAAAGFLAGALRRRGERRGV